MAKQTTTTASAAATPSLSEEAADHPVDTPTITPCPDWCTVKDSHAVSEHVGRDNRLSIRHREQPVFTEEGATFPTVEIQLWQEHRVDRDPDQEPWIDITVRKPVRDGSAIVAWGAMSMDETRGLIDGLKALLAEAGEPE